MIDIYVHLTSVEIVKWFNFLVLVRLYLYMINVGWNFILEG